MSNLKEILKVKGIPVSKMAKETGYSVQCINKWILGRTLPKLYPARDIAGYLGVTDRDIWP